MERQPAIIVDTYLGYWTDDILVAYLIVDFGGVIMGIGGNLLNSADARANREYGEAFAQRLQRACGARTWRELDGTSVNVLFDRPFPRGQAIGVESLPGDPGERFVFADLGQATYADLKAPRTSAASNAAGTTPVSA
jgi:hypothetical protein